MKEPLGLFLMFAGLFAIAGGLLDWDWFINNRKARIFVKLFGRNGARIFYCLLGLAIAVLGILITFEIITSQAS
jgi:drug/metabolite transporter superfamily protein YnfA